MKKMITIYAKCKKELNTKTVANNELNLASLVQNQDVLYSHSICYECGVNRYGWEIMAKVFAMRNLTIVCWFSTEDLHGITKYKPTF